MNNDDRILWIFEKRYGKMTGSCYLELDRDEDEEAVGVNVMKDGNLCWSVSKLDLLFDYILDKELTYERA